MKIASCKTNHLVSPLGFGMDRATVSWIAEDTASKKQTAARVIVAADAGMSRILHDSGKSAALSSLAVDLPVALAPRTRYFWTVQVWGGAGDTAVSDVNGFETGKREEPWAAT
jgi:alpha-L-rhamnosidase